MLRVTSPWLLSYQTFTPQPKNETHGSVQRGRMPVCHDDKQPAVEEVLTDKGFSGDRYSNTTQHSVKGASCSITTYQCLTQAMLLIVVFHHISHKTCILCPVILENKAETQQKPGCDFDDVTQRFPKGLCSQNNRFVHMGAKPGWVLASGNCHG